MGTEISASERQDAFSPNLTQDEAESFEASGVHHEEVVETQEELTETPGATEPIEESHETSASPLDTERLTQAVKAGMATHALLHGDQPMASSSPLPPPRTSLDFSGATDSREEQAPTAADANAPLFSDDDPDVQVIDKPTETDQSQRQLAPVTRLSAQRASSSSGGTAGFTVSGVETTYTRAASNGQPVATVTAKAIEVRTTGGHRVTEVVISATGVFWRQCSCIHASSYSHISFHNGNAYDD